MSTSPKCLSQLIRSKRFAHDTKSWLALCLWKKESALKISNQIKQPYSGKNRSPCGLPDFEFSIAHTKLHSHWGMGEWISTTLQFRLIFDLLHLPISHKQEKGRGSKKGKDKKYEFLKKNSQKHKDFQKEKLDLLKQQHQEGMSLMGKNIV